MRIGDGPEEWDHRGSIFKANTQVLLMNDVLSDDDCVRPFGGWTKGPYPAAPVQVANDDKLPTYMEPIK
jgi:hypothetical protein